MARNRGAKLIRRTEEWRCRIFDPFLTDLPKNKSLLRRLRIFGNSAVADGKITGVGTVGDDGIPFLSVKFHGYTTIGGRPFFDIISKNIPGSVEFSEDGIFATTSFFKDEFIGMVALKATEAKYKVSGDYRLYYTTRYEEKQNAEYTNLKLCRADGSTTEVFAPGSKRNEFKGGHAIGPGTGPAELVAYFRKAAISRFVIAETGIVEYNPAFGISRVAPYVEKYENLRIGDYLHGIGRICDEVDLVLGTLKRKLCKVKLSELSDLVPTEHAGVFMAPLEIAAKEQSEFLGVGIDIRDSESIIAGEVGAGFANEGESLILRAAGCETAAQLREHLEACGAELLYVRQVYSTEPILCPIPEGAEFNRVSLMSNLAPSKFYSEYALEDTHEQQTKGNS